MVKREDTKSLLAKSLLELCRKKSIEKISIFDIVENCSVKRGTFYYYFTDKQDLIKWIYLNETTQTFDKYTGNEPLSITVARMLKFMRDNYNFYRSALEDKTMNNLHEEMIKNKIERSSNYIKHRLKADELSKEMAFAVRFYTYALVEIMEEWLRTGMKECEMEVAEMITASMPVMIKNCYDAVSCNQDWSKISFD